MGPSASTRVHPTAARGFSTGAAAYERSRPDYPPDAVAEIVERLDLRPGRTVLELGAGTGKLTRLLIPSGARVLALEPVAEMRATLARITGGTAIEPQGSPDAASLPATSPLLIDGTAESIPLVAGSVDAVVAAQAFHWFDATRALSEIHRVLRPGGRVLLAWNRRDESVAWVHALGDLVRGLAPDEPQVWDGSWREALSRCALFEPWESRMFRHAQSLTLDGVHERITSISFVAAADADVRARVIENIDSVIRSDPATRDRELIELPYDTEIMSAARRSSDPGDAGIVASVNVSGGGVPKLPVDGATIGKLGLDGDGHRDPDHGGPTAAICLYPQEAIERVRADGHQAFPGAYGDNLTLLGIDWLALRAGDRLVIGADDDEAMLELSRPVTPCETNARWFIDGRYGRISHRAHPEDARWYARVVRTGRVAPGDRVRRMAGPGGAARG